jgi:hypothetical protein
LPFEFILGGCCHGYTFRLRQLDRLAGPGLGEVFLWRAAPSTPPVRWRRLALLGLGEVFLWRAAPSTPPVRWDRLAGPG